MNSQANRFVKLTLLLCALVVASASAFAQTVTYNVMPGTNWSKYHTYQWVTISGAEQVNQILDAQIKQSIDSQLAAKGFVKTDGPTADLNVAYQVSIKQQEQWNAYGGGGFRFGGGMASATQTTLNIGTLDFDAYDVSAKTLIWQGAVTKTLNPPSNQAKKQQNLDKAMAKLLQNFGPPPPKK